jgi:hypothetical protein
MKQAFCCFCKFETFSCRDSKCCSYLPFVPNFPLCPLLQNLHCFVAAAIMAVCALTEDLATTFFHLMLLPRSKDLPDLAAGCSSV